MRADNADEFYDVALRNRKYGRVDPLRGPAVLEKLTHTVEAPQGGGGAADRFAALGSRFGLNKG